MAIKVLEARSVAWAAAQNATVGLRDGRRNRVAPWSGKRLGETVLEGVLHIDDAKTYEVVDGHMHPVVVPKWTVFRDLLGFTERPPDVIAAMGDGVDDATLDALTRPGK